MEYQSNEAQVVIVTTQDEAIFVVLKIINNYYNN
jgi:hypothetical protein